MKVYRVRTLGILKVKKQFDASNCFGRGITSETGPRRHVVAEVYERERTSEQSRPSLKRQRRNIVWYARLQKTQRREIVPSPPQ